MKKDTQGWSRRSFLRDASAAAITGGAVMGGMTGLADAAERVRAKIRDRNFMAAASTYCIRSTNPTPRTVCSSRGPPLDSSLRRKYPMKTSTTFVSAAKS